MELARQISIQLDKFGSEGLMVGSDKSDEIQSGFEARYIISKRQAWF